MTQPTRSLVLWTSVLLVALASAHSVGARNTKPLDWNDAAIEWKRYEEGMQFIEILGKPGILVFYTTWCPHCERYSRVFHDPEVVELSKHFVMIRVDRDRNEPIEDRHAKTGGYVPRTVFLDAKGRVDPKLRGSRDDYPHFLETREPDELVALMRRGVRAASR